MTPLRSVSSSLRTLLVFCALLESIQPDNTTSDTTTSPMASTSPLTTSSPILTTTFPPTTTTPPMTTLAVLGPVTNLTVGFVTSSSLYVTWTGPVGGQITNVTWTGGNTSNSESVSVLFKNITNLTPGVMYNISVTPMVNVTAGTTSYVSQYTKPGVVNSLTVSAFTTTSVSLNWAKPEGNNLFYTVMWTNNSLNQQSSNVTTTYVTISELTPGVEYNFSVTAVAGDYTTIGEETTVSLYTKPGVVNSLTVSASTTTSVSLNWAKPEGNFLFYTVMWTNNSLNQQSSNVTTANVTISELTPGVEYNFSVTAVAGDYTTIGEETTISLYTKPDLVNDQAVTKITTSSISVNWTKPLGMSSFYVVQWTDGTANNKATVMNTSITITNLIAGVHYKISVSAVADDEITEGAVVVLSQYTEPGVVNNLTGTASTTTTVSLNWTKPEGNSFFYIVQWTNSSLNQQSSNVTTTYVTIPELTPGVKYNFSVTAVAGDNKTTGQATTVSQYTKPGKIEAPVTSATNYSISLSWPPPPGNVFTYEVKWSNGANSTLFSKTTSNNSAVLNNLTAGTNYTITITAFAGGNQGDPYTISQFTRPEKPVNLIVTTRGTDFLNITWTLPSGRVDYYTVNVSSSDVKYSNNTNSNTFNLINLLPGRVFLITVMAVAGTYSETSDQSSFATYPTPTGSIVINSKTNSSLQLEWTTPPNMNGAPNISYHITYQPVPLIGSIQTIDSTGNYTQLPNLNSGILYNITIITVGPQNLNSVAAFTSSYTLPNLVERLTANSYSTISMNAAWSMPLGYQPYYQYFAQIYNMTGALITQDLVNGTSWDVSNLDPGSNYSISVRTRAANGTESAPVSVTNYTMPKAVTNLTNNVTTTTIQLFWTRQSDYKSSYSYLVEIFSSQPVSNGSTQNETFTFYNLIPGTQYTIYVTTVIEGVRSTKTNQTIYTIPAVVPVITVIGNTTTLSVNWSSASGQVSSYVVSLSLESNKTEIVNQTHQSNKTQALFVGLKPGVGYCVGLVTRSGSVQSDKATVCNATFPGPPGSVTVNYKTTNSINFSWSRPDTMDQNSFNFSVNGTNLTGNSWFLLNNLQSGTRYTISVVTVGVRGYMSTPVMTTSDTKPYNVTNLTATKITTNTVILDWNVLEGKTGYSFEVLVQNAGSPVSVRNTTSTSFNVTGLSSGTNYSFTVTTLTADGTRADPVTQSNFTRPNPITHLGAETLNKTSIFLNWTKPIEYKSNYTYKVKTTGCSNRNDTSSLESAVIPGLTPGTNCTFCVSVIASNVAEGEELCTSQYTKPEFVQPRVYNQGSNSSVLVSWTLPNGNVDNFNISINSTLAHFYKSVQLNSPNTSFVFDNLAAGVLYSVVLTTCSGPLSETSDLVNNATYPNPPGPIMILQKTTSSISFHWGEAPLMSGASFKYVLTCAQTLQDVNTTIVPPTDTTHIFSLLLSGTPYNLSVKTQGPMDFQSMAVYSNLVTTMPNSVQNLSATPGEKNISVTWSKPAGYKESYGYILTGKNSTYTTNTTTYTISNLDPGSMYNISVTTVTSDGTQAASNIISLCTDASPVKDLDCYGPNLGIATIICNWTKVEGLSSAFRYTVMGSSPLIQSSSLCCTLNISDLSYNTKYNLAVETLSCGNPSPPVFKSCQTGITNPTLPSNWESLVPVKGKTKTSFTVQVDPILLNGTWGPVTNVGILVSRNNYAQVSADKGFLAKTYKNWKENLADGYLAAIITISNSSASRSTQGPLSIDVGTGTSWKDYFNGPLDPAGSYKYAIAIFTLLDLNSTTQLVSINSIVSITNFNTVTIDSDIIPIAVGAAVAVFGIFLVLLLGFAYWRRSSKKKEPDIPIQQLGSRAVRVEEFEAYYRKQKADSNCGFAEEFEELKPVGTSQAKIHALALENKPKNRYNNVLPYDSSRVKLSIVHGNPNGDYINADYMPGYLSRKEFIAAQGPLPVTVSDFWRMIWEKNVYTLVMLTRCNEQGRVKCEQYWGPGTMHYKDITVTITTEIPLEDWTIREFSVKNVKTTEVRLVRHFHFTAWPDHGVPETTELLISFRHLVREHMNQYTDSPTVVHCSAGVGRTGTFIAIDRLIYQIERDNIVDVYGIVHDLRMHRPLMVQTEDQYVFLNQCALDIIRSRTGTNVDLIYQNTEAISIYENVEPKKAYPKRKQ
ncbi:receptor-type tyrosine-protein phosphatase eta isoform X3 [Nothobranchius furzeri]|uniref:receptor-type tyrosine-protein phosphatase eta isoform X3 n=1 Tax=Nothobranchius furzeri TaxID=105023 RepID=UPI003904C3E4